MYVLGHIFSYMNSNEVFLKLESIDDTRLASLINHTMTKVEEFAKILKIDPAGKGALRDLLIIAVNLSDFWISTFGIFGSDSKNVCSELLKKIAHETINKTQTIFYLSREIVKEIKKRLRELIKDESRKDKINFSQLQPSKGSEKKR